MDAARILLGSLLLLPLSSHGWERFTVEAAAGAKHTQETLLLFGVVRPAKPLFGVESYLQLNVGGWDGSRAAVTAGVARGLQWQAGRARLRASLGASLISETSDDSLSTAFQFYEQIALQWPLGAGAAVALSYRHWSNGRIKHPNGGLNFLGLEYRW